MLDEEFSVLVSRFELSYADATMLRNVLHFCCVGETWEEWEGRVGVDRRRCQKFVQELLKVHDFDAGIRYDMCERTEMYDEYTMIIDHTTTNIGLHPSNDVTREGFDFTSGHKGVVYKYLVYTTLQGTPISISGCQPGLAS